MTVNVQGLSRGMFPLKALYFGEQVKDNYALQIRTLVNEARSKLGEVPVVFGECGIPIDLKYVQITTRSDNSNEEAFRNGDWKWQERMLDALISAMEASMVGFNLWAYNPYNRDDVGDNWNAESFSWFSESNRSKALDDMDGSQAALLSRDLDVGARLLSVIVRPYAVATAGTPLSSTFQRSTSLFTHRFRDQPGFIDIETKKVEPSKITEIFLPSRLYGGTGPDTPKFNISPGGRSHWDKENQRLFVWFDDSDLVINRGTDVTRRIDVWVGEASDTNYTAIVLTMILFGMVGFVAINELMRHYWGTPMAQLPLLYHI